MTRMHLNIVALESGLWRGEESFESATRLVKIDPRFEMRVSKVAADQILLL